MNQFWHPINLTNRISTAKVNPVITLNSNIFLAPLAGASDLSMRKLCRRMGAGLTYTELVSARGLCYSGLEKSWRYIRIEEEERPVAIQLFGHEPDDFAGAIELILKDENLPNPTLIDINMGCPVAKVTKTMAGSALMKDPDLAVKIVESCQKMLAGTGIPLSCKFRRGYDKDSNTAADFALAMIEAGVAMIAVHGRTRAQGYSGQADWQCIAEVNQVAERYAAKHGENKVPVIANGDIVDGFTACEAMKRTGADGVMIGRGALGNPWIFREIEAYMKYGLKIASATAEEKVEAIRNQYFDYLAFHDERTAARELRKVLGWYLHGLRGAATLRKQAVQVEDKNDVENLLRQILNA